MHVTRLWTNCTAIVAALTLVVAAGAATADFNSIAEANYGTQLSDGGITFFDAEINNGPIETFAIDDASEIFALHPDVLDYVDGSVLNVNGMIPGPGNLAFCAIGAMKMTTGQLESYASMSVLYLVEDSQNDFSNNTVTLEALRNGVVVASDTVFTDNVLAYPPRFTFGASSLEISGVEFDTLRFVSAGPENNGVMLGSIDNVVITPEPSALALLALGGIAALRRR